MLDFEALAQKAKIIRSTCVRMAYDARETHLSSALSCVDLLTVMFGGFLNYSKGAGGCASGRDRFIMSKGHGCSALYAAMAAYGIIPAEMLKTYSKTDSPLPNHPCKYALPIIEISTGSLGYGLGIASGIVYGLKLKGEKKDRAVVLMSDAECNEGSTWEAAMFSSANELANLLAVVDDNGHQAVARAEEVTGRTSIEEKFRSFGWNTLVINGNDISAVTEAFQKFPFSETKPSVIIAKTTLAYGISHMEGKHFWFYKSPDRDDVDKAIKELGVMPLYSMGDD